MVTLVSAEVEKEAELPAPPIDLTSPAGQRAGKGAASRNYTELPVDRSTWATRGGRAQAAVRRDGIQYAELGSSVKRRYQHLDGRAA